MTVKDLTIIVENMKQNSDEKDIIIKTLEEKMLNLQNWVQEAYSHLTKKNQDSDLQNFNNSKVLENKLIVLENKMFESNKNPESEKEESFKCRDCETIVDSKKNLKVHILAVHPPEFKCKFCGQMFGTSVAYELHLKTHDEVDKFKCDLCDQSFYMKWRLRKHKKQHQMTNVKYCHYFNNSKTCDYLEIGCMFNHQEAPLCRNGKFCKIRLCQFRHILNCESCDFTSTSQKAFKDHQAQPHEQTKSPEVVYSCDLCEFTSNFEDVIKTHRTAQHEATSSTTRVEGGQENDNDNFEDDDDDDGPYDCDHCVSNKIKNVYHTSDFNDLIRHIHNDHGLNTVWGPLSCT